MDALRRVAVREYTVTEMIEAGRTKKRLVRLDASSANAIGNLVRVLMDIEGQRAGEEMKKITAELEEMRVIVGGILEGRG